MTRILKVFVFFLLVNCAITLKCLEGIAGGKCVFPGQDDVQNPPSYQISSFTSQPLPKPEALSMLAEDEHSEVIFPSTTMPTTTTIAATDEPKGRAINFTIEEQNKNKLSNSSAGRSLGDLSDVSMDDEDELVPKILTPKLNDSNLTLSICVKGGLTYENGEKLEHGCDSVCTCMNGKMDCTDRCSGPYFRKGKKIDDPLCVAKDVDDPCCSILVCAADTETEPLEMCIHNNKTYNRGDKFEQGCELSCSCEAAGKVSCKQRCPPMNKTSDSRCVEIPDPKDSCCKTVLCDVTLDDHEPEKELEETSKIKILSAKFLNTTTIKLKFDATIDTKQLMPEVEVSEDKMNWKPYKLIQGNYIQNVNNNVRYVRIANTDSITDIQTDDIMPKLTASSNKNDTKSCEYKGKRYKLKEEFNDNCTSFCVCQESGVKCLKLECPTYFGVDVLDPNCIEWETVPPNFVPSPPNCCPEEVKCKNNGSCLYEDVMYQNWQQIPSNITGCEKRCYCEMGKIECQNVCPPVTALPPSNLPCPPHQAALNHLPDDDCCMYWMCPSSNKPGPGGGQGFPGGFLNIPPNYHQSHDDITVHLLEALDSHTIRLAFSVPPVIVGLHGRVEVRYTYKDNDNPDTWELQIFAPPNDLIETAQLEFDLVDLKPDTEYKIKITVTLRDLHNTPSSRVYTVRTLKLIQTTTLPPMIPIEPNLVITDINATWVNIMWRKFTEYELQFIDGVQLRYKEIDGKLYAATPLIHRAVTSYTLENLKPNSKYEIGIFFIPFPGQQTELHSEHMIHFTTANEVDTYGFNVTLEIAQVKATSVEITWSGVPYPEDKFVNIYRAIYQSDSGKEDFSTFKIAKRDSPPKTVIMDIKPGTRYRLWLEVYLTNGKIKTSNVQDFITKPRSAPALGASTQQGKLESEKLTEPGDYYGPLVIVAILAAVAILSTIVLLLILVKRHTQNKAAITPPTRVSQSAYDNPTYKVELQQETMGL